MCDFKLVSIQQQPQDSQEQLCLLISSQAQLKGWFCVRQVLLDVFILLFWPKV